MEPEQSQENADWRARQKERERERRRMRDRQRRQSMSLEEREKHLARRRKNYQLRRQRAANTQLGHQQINMSMSNVAGTEPAEIQDDDVELVQVPEVDVQCDFVMQDEFNEAHEEQKAPVMKYDGETTVHEPYKYPRIPRLTQIKHLARRLNSPLDKSSADNQGINGAFVIKEDMINPLRVHGRRIRLTHLKHLARALHSNVGKFSEENQLCKMQGHDDVSQREIDQMKSEGAFGNGQSNDAA